MNTIFKNVDYSLVGLVLEIENGTIGLPDIQRPFIWKPSKVRDLFDSMYKGFPIGYLLFWANDVAPGSKQIGTGEKQQVPKLLIVDGQQRLTSLFAVLRGKPVIREDFSERHIRIAFRPRDAQFDVATGPIRKDAEYIPDISELWSKDVQLYTYINRFLARLAKHRESKGEPFDQAEQDRVAGAIGRLHNLQNYPFTALQIHADIDAEQVSDIFVRINSKGVPLNQADFILTLMSVHWDEGRKQLEAFSRSSRQPGKGASAFNYYMEPDPDQLLRVSVALAFRRARLELVYSVLRGKDMETGVVSEARRIEQFARLSEVQSIVLDLNHWHGYLKVPLLAGYTGGWMISSQTGLTYAYAMYLIARHDFGLDHATARNVLARWFFMTAITARYSTSPESTMEADLARLRGVEDGAGFVRTLDRLVRDALTEDFWNITLPNDLATSAARSPALFGYYAALNLLDATVLFSQLKVASLLDPALSAKKKSLERHHLFPRGHLKKQGYTSIKDINQIANFALIEWPDNIKISASPPSEHFPKFVKRAFEKQGFDDLEYKRMLRWHALSPGWENMEYEQFLEDRRKRMAQVTRDGFERLLKKTGGLEVSTAVA